VLFCAWTKEIEPIDLQIQLPSPFIHSLSSIPARCHGKPYHGT
jgi:hypothetical protein